MNRSAYTLIYTFVLTVVFVAATSAVAVLLRPRIDLNERLREKRVVLEVAGLLKGRDLDAQAIDDLYDSRISRLTDRDTQDLLILAVDGGRNGYVLKTGGQGYWGPIEGYVGVDADLEKITGIAFVKHVETPGLGGEITKSTFRDQFKGRSPREAVGDEPMIEFVPPDAERTEWQVHAITGATRTSTAVEAFLDRDLRTFLAVMKQGK